MTQLSLRALAWASALGWGAAVAAPLDALTLPAAIERALETHAELAGFAFELRAEQARVSLAALAPPPEAELIVEDALGTGARSGVSSAQTTLSLSQVIELGGKRSLRTDLARAELARLRTEHDVRQLDRVADVARRFVEVLAQQARADAAHDGVALAERMLDAVSARVEAAAAPNAERSRAQVELAEARLALDDAEHRLDTLRHGLAAAMGLEAVDFGPLRGDLLRFPQTASFDTLLARLEASPDFLLFAQEARLHEAAVELAERQRRADLRASFGVRHHPAGDDVSLVAGVSLPLFAARQAAPRIDAAIAEADGVAARRRTAYVAARHRLYAYCQELEHERHVAEVLRDDIAPSLERALDETRAAYERGRYAYLQWIDARQQLLDARLRLIDAAADFHLYRIDVERLTGASVDAIGDLP